MKLIKKTTSTKIADDLSVYAAQYHPQLSQLFCQMEPSPWVTRLDAWFDTARYDPSAAMSESALMDALALLVSLMHAHMQFGLLHTKNRRQADELISADQCGGAVPAATARADLMRLVKRHDRALATRLAAATLHRIEEQRAMIAKHINAAPH